MIKCLKGNNRVIETGKRMCVAIADGYPQVDRPLANAKPFVPGSDQQQYIMQQQQQAGARRAKKPILEKLKSSGKLRMSCTFYMPKNLAGIGTFFSRKLTGCQGFTEPVLSTLLYKTNTLLRSDWKYKCRGYSRKMQAFTAKRVAWLVHLCLLLRPPLPTSKPITTTQLNDK